MPDWFMALAYIFPVQIFATRALNSEADDRFRKTLWTIEKVCLIGVVLSFLTLQTWLVQITLTASVTVFLLRALVRFFGLGIVRIGKMAGSGLAVLGNVVGVLLVAFVKAVPDGIADAAEPKPRSGPALRFSVGGRGGYNYSTGECDIEPGLRYISDEE